MRSTVRALGVAVLVAAAGCGGHASAVATTSTTAGSVASPSTVPTTTVASTSSSSTVPSTTTTQAIDTSGVPAVITVPYINAVLAQLNHVYGNAVRLVVQTGTVPPAAIADVRSVFNDPEFENQINIFTQEILEPLDFVRRPPGDRVTTVRRLISSTRGCVFAETSTDYSRVDVTAVSSPVGEFFELRLKQMNDDPDHLNPTPWAIEKAASFHTNLTPSNPCIA